MENMRLPSSIFSSSVRTGYSGCKNKPKAETDGTHLLIVIVLLVLLVLLLVLIIAIILVFVLTLFLQTRSRFLFALHTALCKLFHHLQELLSVVLEQIVRDSQYVPCTSAYRSVCQDAKKKIGTHQ